MLIINDNLNFYKMAQYKHPGVYDGDSSSTSSTTAKETETPVSTEAEVQLTEDEDTSLDATSNDVSFQSIEIKKDAITVADQ